MEEKKTIKVSISAFFLVLAVITIIIMGIYISKLNNDKNMAIQKSNELQTQVNSLNGTVSELQGKINSISETISLNSSNEINNTTNTNTENIKREKISIPSIYSSKNSNNTSITVCPCTYDDLVYFYIINGKPYLNIYGNNEKINENLKRLKMTFGDDIKISSHDNEITGFNNKKVIDISVGNNGQSAGSEAVLFLMEDGSVEYSTFNNLFKNWKSQGKISELSNIIKFQDATIGEGENNHPAVLCFDIDNNVYKLTFDDNAKYTLAK